MIRTLNIQEIFREKAGVSLSISGFKTGVISNSLELKQQWEPHIQYILGSILRSDDVFLDVGANVGIHTVFASKFVKKVISIEPSKEIFEHLLKTIELNNCDNITCHNIGLWDQDETKLFCYLPKDSGNSHFTITDYHKSNAENIEVKRLDSLNIAHIDVVKMDVEGVEKFVLKGGEKCFNKCPTLFIELNVSACLKHTGEDIMEILYQIMSFGYETIYYARCWKNANGCTWERTNFDGLVKALSIHRGFLDVIFMPSGKNLIELNGHIGINIRNKIRVP